MNNDKLEMREHDKAGECYELRCEIKNLRRQLEEACSQLSIAEKTCDVWREKSEQAEADTKRAIELAEAYVDFAKRAEQSMAGLAFAHGYVCPSGLIQEGKQLRSKIEAMKK